jgi:fimbrial isopeptide formation D2 family protein/LPXTG-motif cell wall-anchored protein
MTKNFKLVLALALSIMMVLGSVAMADTNPVVNTHTIKITNTDQKVNHTYEGYKVFSGNLNADQTTLSDVQWGNGVDSAALIAELMTENAKTDSVLKGKFDGITAASTAADVAKKLSGWTSTKGENEEASLVDAFAAIVQKHIVAANKIDFTRNDKTYTASADSDGYYFIQDVTADADLDGTDGTDSLSKYLLRITDDIDIVAKDTGSQSNKVIVEGGSDVNDNNKNIGDTITYKSTLNPIPNPTKFDKVFKLTMEDTMEKSLTFTGISSITLGSKTLDFGTDYYFIYDGVTYDSALTEETATAKKAFTAPTDPVGAQGDNTANHTLRVILKGARALILNNNAVGQTLTVNYTAVLNADAELAPESNDNTVKFQFSNDANYDYDGDSDDWKPNEPQGKTPEKTVETYTTALEIKKVDGSNSNAPLAGATFTITAADVFNVVRETGDTFVAYTDADSANAAQYTYWKLKDGSYTTTDPATVTDPDTQYDGTTKYKKVHYDDTIVSPDASSSNKVYTVTSDENGIIRLEGIKAGNYTITEVAAPDGYNKIDGSATAKFAWDHVHAANVWTKPASGTGVATGGYTLTSEHTGNYGDFEAGTGADIAVAKITIQNFSGAQLPSTGGIGTTIFYVAGSIMVLAAAILLITKRRMGAND